nr:hypothetical protein CFP56_28001 [Quercus suber]
MATVKDDLSVCAKFTLGLRFSDATLIHSWQSSATASFGIAILIQSWRGKTVMLAPGVEGNERQKNFMAWKSAKTPFLVELKTMVHIAFRIEESTKKIFPAIDYLRWMKKIRSISKWKPHQQHQGFS